MSTLVTYRDSSQVGEIELTVLLPSLGSTLDDGTQTVVSALHPKPAHQATHVQNGGLALIGVYRPIAFFHTVANRLLTGILGPIQFLLRRRTPALKQTQARPVFGPIQRQKPHAIPHARAPVLR